MRRARTLLVEGAIAAPDSGGVPDGSFVDAGPDGGPCDDAPFDDGVADGGLTFKGNVTLLTVRGPASPPPLHAQPGYFPSFYAFVSQGHFYAGAADDRGPGVYGRLDQASDPAPTALVVGPAHAYKDFYCAHVMAGYYDSSRSKTLWLLHGPGCSSDNTPTDAGITVGAPDNRAAIGWLGLADGGGVYGHTVGGAQIGCPEGAYPPSCARAGAGIPLESGGPQRLEGLLTPFGAGSWIVSADGLSNSDGELAYWSQDLASRGSPSGPLGGASALVTLDKGVAARLRSGQLRASLFDAQTGGGAPATLDLRDPGASGLSLASFDTGYALATWIGSDGRARVLEIDATLPTLTFSDIRTLCGAGNVRTVAALNTHQLIVLEGASLSVRSFR